jgi:hypothetical protein
MIGLRYMQAMDSSFVASRRSNVKKSITQVSIVTAAALLLTACSGGADGQLNSIGSGQEPDPATVDFPLFYDSDADG